MKKYFKLFYFNDHPTAKVGQGLLQRYCMLNGTNNTMNISSIYSHYFEIYSIENAWPMNQEKSLLR